MVSLLCLKGTKGGGRGREGGRRRDECRWSSSLVIGGDNLYLLTPELSPLPMTGHLSISKVHLRDLASSIISVFYGVFQFDLFDHILVVLCSRLVVCKVSY